MKKYLFLLLQRMRRVGLLVIITLIGFSKPTPLSLRAFMVIFILIGFFAPEIGRYLNKPKERKGHQ